MEGFNWDHVDANDDGQGRQVLLEVHVDTVARRMPELHPEGVKNDPECHFQGSQ